MTKDGWIRAGGRTSGALLLALVLTLALAVLCAGRANAEARIKVACEVYDTNTVDPIAHSTHRHRQFGNTSTTNQSTGDSLLANTETSCDQEWFTSAGWFPVEKKNEPVDRVTIYYRAPGDQTKIRAIPKGLQLIATDHTYNCNKGPFRDTPPYGCEGRFGTRVIFPDCWDESSLEETTTVSSNARGECPASHPYRLPRINYLIQHKNTDHVVSDPLRVSAGDGTWEKHTSMHADYFAANQPIFNDTLLDKCLRNVPDGGDSPAECG